jgi:hypothetical protein
MSCTLCLADIETGAAVVTPCDVCKTVAFHDACWDESVRAGFGKQCMICRKEFQQQQLVFAIAEDVHEQVRIGPPQNPFRPYTIQPFLILHELTSTSVLISLLLRDKSSLFAIITLANVTIGVGICAFINGCLSPGGVILVSPFLATVMTWSLVAWLLFVVNVVYEPAPESVVYAVWSTILLGAVCGVFDSITRRVSRVVPVV